MGITARIVKRANLFPSVITLVLCIGVLPFLFPTSAQAQEAQEHNAAYYFDEYKEPVGFTYGAKVVLNANYLWRGLYCGALNIQPSANVGYGGLYLDMWWNIGVPDWKFNAFQPELDLSLGFARWGLDIYVLYIHNFNCGFFDFNNYADRGNRLARSTNRRMPNGYATVIEELYFLWFSPFAAGTRTCVNFCT